MDDFLPLGRWGLPDADDVASGGLGGLVGDGDVVGLSELLDPGSEGFDQFGELEVGGVVVDGEFATPVAVEAI